MDRFGFFDRTLGLLHKVLNLRLRNQQVIASNIANADTPGYAPARLSFEDDLRRALSVRPGEEKGSHPAHFQVGSASLEKVQGRLLRTPEPSGIGDRNGVRLDQEMIALAENQILYEAATQMLNKKLGMLKYTAQDGR